MKFPLLTRIEAMNLGRKRFYTGVPCKYGHDAQRFVTTGNCVACNAARAKAFSDGIRANSKAAQAGAFIYPLKNPADMAAAWAYCQALDIASGFAPTLAPNTPPPSTLVTPTPRGAEPLALPADIARHRQTLVDTYGPKTGAPIIPKP